MSTYTLPRVSHRIIEKSYYWGEEFSNLQDVFIDGPVAFISYRGNLYEVRVRSSYYTFDGYQYDEVPVYANSYQDCSYYAKKCIISIYDTINNNLIGRGTYDLSYLNTRTKHEITFEIRKAVRSAIVRVNIKPTDFYK